VFGKISLLKWTPQKAPTEYFAEAFGVCEKRINHFATSNDNNPIISDALIFLKIFVFLLYHILETCHESVNFWIIENLVR